MELTCPGWVAGWPGSDNMTISVQLNLTGTGTGTELGNKQVAPISKVVINVKLSYNAFL